ncbi:uncharacterized protein FRV6_16889 [Fusarium oxysporum]|uniref:Uncharacterized protein n=1 Tax=Fusarium oxysporum TaxID=5507 RepID=A0A2H3U483_FUSOX|nr:uncharacterized protein FRV6_16889 [Fusarium oxysporum]
MQTLLTWISTKGKPHKVGASMPAPGNDQRQQFVSKGNGMVHYERIVGRNDEMEHGGTPIIRCCNKGFSISSHPDADRRKIMMIATKRRTKRAFCLSSFECRMPIAVRVPDVEVTLTILRSVDGSHLILDEAMHIGSEPTVTPTLYLGDVCNLEFGSYGVEACADSLDGTRKIQEYQRYRAQGGRLEVGLEGWGRIERIGATLISLA